uniref:cytochrome c oxidase subunit II n=1 Tax=Agapetus zniachtl TaxID=1875106 RepID=UPI0022DCE0A0|nr:cytochrome c oxidase subunit II [Agapetus zniachtl]UZZ43729.1 cytochrome c oxidase subunit II [Agapetus zniachtl]
MATWSNLTLQNSASPLMEELVFFHDHIMLITLMITIYVGYLLFNNLTNKFIDFYTLDHDSLEVIWTILPGLVLLFLVFPSLRILYLLDEMASPALTLKAIGHQWYWNYEYSDFKNINFDSYMLPENEMNSYNFRLLDVDNRTVVPMNTQIRMVITAADVLHSWTVPALGVKIDATPGRLNQSYIYLFRPGLFYGQCSEICGANHSFMPIVLESINSKMFINWVKNF